jgi:phage baseplate assembly protein gpV
MRERVIKVTTKTLLIDAEDAVYITTKDYKVTAQAITQDAPQTTTTGKHAVQGKLEANAGMSSKGGGSTFEGDFKQTGGSMSSNGVVADKHRHGKVQSGSDTSDIPSS